MDPRHPGLVALGALIKQLRAINNNMTQKKLAHLTGYAESTISSVETGQEWPSLALVEAFDHVFGTEALRTFYKQVRGLDFPAWFFDWLQIERQAVVLRVFELNAIFGLLQTPAYARVMLCGDEAATAARIDRQGILTRDDPPPPRLHCVIDEGALHRDIGGPEVMREQLRHLAEHNLPRVNVHIVPSRMHEGIRGSFVLATLADGSTMAYSEGAFRGAATTNAEELATINASWESVRSQAYPVDMSRDFIVKTIEERWKN